MSQHRISEYNDYVSLVRGANQLRLSRRRTLALIHAGQLRARLVDGAWWVDLASIEAFARLRRRYPHVAHPTSSTSVTCGG